MHQSFRNGFEKVAPQHEKLSYDYKHERKLMEKERLSRSKEQPLHYGKSVGVGALAGGAFGGLMGALAAGGSGALTGMGYGAAGGGLLGAGIAAADRADINNARYVAQLDPTERAELLASVARSREVEATRDAIRYSHSYPSHGYPYSHRGY